MKIMPLKKIDLKVAQSRLRELVSSGKEVILTEGKVPRARLVPLANGGPMAPAEKVSAKTEKRKKTRKFKRIPGLGKGTIWISDDFDDPLPDEFWLGNCPMCLQALTRGGTGAQPHPSSGVRS